MANKFDVDPDLVRKLAELLGENGLSEIEYESTGRRIRVARQISGGPAVVWIERSVANTNSPFGALCRARAKRALHFAGGMLAEPATGTEEDAVCKGCVGAKSALTRAVSGSIARRASRCA